MIESCHQSLENSTGSKTVILRNVEVVAVGLILKIFGPMFPNYCLHKELKKMIKFLSPSLSLDKYKN